MAVPETTHKQFALVWQDQFARTKSICVSEDKLEVAIKSITDISSDNYVRASKIGIYELRCSADQFNSVFNQSQSEG